MICKENNILLLYMTVNTTNKVKYAISSLI